MSQETNKILGCTLTATYIFGLPGALAWITNTSWAGFFFFMSLLLFLGQIWSIYQGVQSKKWPTAEGIVIQSYVRISPGGDSGDIYEPRISYGYSISGKPYESNSISYKQNPNTTSRGPADNVISKYPKGSRVRVYYDPDNPTNAVLETGLGDGWPYLLLMLFFATTIGTGIWAYVVWPGLNFDNIRGLFSLQ